MIYTWALKGFLKSSFRARVHIDSDENVSTCIHIGKGDP